MKKRAMVAPSSKIILTALLFTSLLSGVVRSQTQIPQPQDSLRLALDYEVLGQYEKAIQVLAKLYRKSPRNISYYQGLRRNMLRLQRLDDLEKLIKDRIRSRNDLQAKVDLADLLFRKGQEQEAFAEWNRILESHKRNADAYQAVARSLTENRLFDEAIDVYRRGRVELNKPTLFVFAVADLYVARLNYREATRENLLFLKENPNQWAVIQSRISLYTKTPEAVSEVAEVLYEELASSPFQLQIRRLLGSLFLRVRDYKVALEQLTLADELDTNTDRRRGTEGRDLFQFAETARHDGAYEFAEQAYRLVISNYPESLNAKRAEYTLALLLKEQGRYDEAREALALVAFRRKRTREAYLALYQLADIWFEHYHDVSKCEQVLQQLLEEYPNNPERHRAVLKLGDCKVVRNQLEEAAALYKSALVGGLRQPDDVLEASLFKLAEVAFYAGELDTAVLRLKRLTSLSVPRGSTQQGQLINDALDLLLLIEENRGDNDALRLYARAKLLERQWQEEAALETLYGIVQEEPVPEVADEAWLEIGEIEATLGCADKALAAYDKLLGRFPGSHLLDMALRMKAEVYEVQLADFALAQKTFEDLLAMYPQSVFVEEVRQKIRALEDREDER